MTPNLPVRGPSRAPLPSSASVLEGVFHRNSAALDFLAARENTNRKALIEKFVRNALQSHLMDARMLVRMADGNPASGD